MAIPYFLGLYSYQKITISLEQYFFAGAWGESMVQIGVGKIFGAAPYTFSFLHQGNGSYIFQSNGLNTMNIGEFISTEYISLKYEHNFNGFFLGKIPGLKRLKWREVVGMRLLTGSMKYLYIIQPETIDFFTFKNYLPLIEFNVGLDNIFQFLRVDAVFRATYLNHPNVEKVGVRASINLSF